MNQLKKIGEISTEYGITSRTLRYYEEVGLIESIRIYACSNKYISRKIE